MILCPFCAEWKDPQYFKAYIGNTWTHEHRVLYRDSECFALPGYGPQVYPYALIVPSRHCTEMLGVLDITHRLSIFRVLDKLLMSELFPSNRLSIFEHGGCRGQVGSCIDHAHFHVLDSSVSVRHWFREDRPDAVPISWSATSGPTDLNNYLFAGEYDGDGIIHGFCASDDETESQYFRRLLARRLGLGHWDWRSGMNDHWMKRLVDEFWQRVGKP